MVAFTLSNACWWIDSHHQGFFFALFFLVVLVSPHFPPKSERGAAFHYIFATYPYSIGPYQGIIEVFWHYWADWAQGLSAPFCCGLIPPLVRMYPKYSVSCTQKTDLVALIFSPAFCNWIKTCFNLSRWSSRLLLVMTKRSSMYALTIPK